MEALRVLDKVVNAKIIGADTVGKRPLADSPEEDRESEAGLPEKSEQTESLRGCEPKTALIASRGDFYCEPLQLPGHSPYTSDPSPAFGGNVAMLFSEHPSPPEQCICRYSVILSSRRAI